MLRYKINKISEVGTDQLLDFYKKVYKNRYKSLTNNWRWWYRVGHSEYEPLILSIDNKIIGQAGLLPVDLNILEKNGFKEIKRVSDYNFNVRCIINTK